MANVNKGKIMAGVRKAGRPSKDIVLENKIKKAEEKMAELEVLLQMKVTVVHEMMVKEYEDHIKFLSQVAKGEVKGASMANRIDCAKTLIKRVDELKEKLELSEIDGESLDEEILPTDSEEEVEKKVISLIKF